MASTNEMGDQFSNAGMTLPMVDSASAHQGHNGARGSTGKAPPIRAVRLNVDPDMRSALAAMKADAGEGPETLAPSSGNLLRKLRVHVRNVMNERDLTQADVAAACGITQSTLSAWLCGRKDLSGTNLLAVLETLRIDLAS